MKTELVLEDGKEIPAVLTLPNSNGAVPAALLLHAFSSRKEQMANSVGRAPEGAIRDAADWLATQLGTTNAHARPA
jgi:fermentation-respiration switch protein FrsA (DUF1100 family)